MNIRVTLACNRLAREVVSGQITKEAAQAELAMFAGEEVQGRSIEARFESALRMNLAYLEAPAETRSKPPHSVITERVPEVLPAEVSDTMPESGPASTPARAQGSRAYPRAGERIRATVHGRTVKEVVGTFTGRVFTARTGAVLGVLEENGRKIYIPWTSSRSVLDWQPDVAVIEIPDPLKPAEPVDDRSDVEPTYGRLEPVESIPLEGV